jgi:uncharacterized protein
VSRIRLAAAAATAAGLVGLLATPAWAHVSASSPDAQQGGEANITFQMPDESDSANSVKLQVALPTDTPFASVDVLPQPGWNYQLATTKLAQPITTDDGDQVTDAVSSITWTATNGGIKPGEFGQFTVSVGPLPKTNSLVFKAIQTYSDGTVVRWIDLPTGNGQEPEHPAPTIALTAASAQGGDNAATPNASSAPASTQKSNSSNALAIVALVLGALGLLTGLAALALARRLRSSALSGGAGLGTSGSGAGDPARTGPVR